MRVLVVGAGMYVTGRGTEGTGTILPALAQASRQLPIERVVICATSENSRTPVLAAVDRVNAALGTSLRVEYRLAAEALADPVADCAIVAVPDHLHRVIAEPLVSRRMPCLVVKPLTPTLADGLALLALQERSGVHVAVELHKRYDEANQLARRMVRDGTLGHLSYATVEYSQRTEVPTRHFKAWASRTNVFQYLGVHYVDLLHFLTGFRPEKALAVGTRGILATHGIDTFDSVHATILWRAPGGAPFVSQLAVGWIDPSRSTAMSDQRYTLVGSAGRLDCDQKHRGVELVTDSGAHSINPYFSEYLCDGTGRLKFAGYGARSVEQFLIEVRDGPAAIILSATLREALVATAVVDAVNRSLAADGEWSNVDAPA
jgi:D-galacturonate reductase